MTKSTKTWMCGATLALSLGVAGCDEGPAIEAAPGEVTFRGGEGTWGPGKLNTHFLGKDSTYPLTSIPLSDDPTANVRLHAIWATRCVDRQKGKIYTNDLFYTSDLDGVLGVSVLDGDLESATFRRFGDPNVTCTVSSKDWKNTVWGVITVDDQGVEHNHYLMILDRRLDDHGNRVFKWGVWTGLGHPLLSDYYTPSCAEDLDPFGTFDLRFHAYLVDGLEVDEHSGDFTSGADSFFIACRSGAIGKAIDWGYAPWVYGTDVHELATRVVRADYCGDGGTFTVEGNALQVRDGFGVNGFPKPNLAHEAAWDLDVGGATCLTTPRDAQQQIEIDGPLLCNEGLEDERVLYPCTNEAIDGSIFATKILD